MGNCCGGGANEGEINMIRGGATRSGTEHILDGRQVAGLKGGDKIILIIKIQALLRGAIARKKIK